MHSVRINRTALTASSFIKEPPLQIESPYEVPISRVLQIERDRGFESENGRHQHGHSFHRHCQPSASFYTVTRPREASLPTPLSLVRRTFSVQSSQRRPPTSTPLPPRRPPPSPGPRSGNGTEPWLRRAPSSPLPSPGLSSPSNRAFAGDDASASIIVTSEQIEKQQRRERAEELQTRKAQQAWSNSLRIVQDEARNRGLDIYPSRSVQKVVMEELHETRMAYLAHLNARFEMVRDALLNARVHFDRHSRLARPKGQRDYAMHAISQTRKQMDDLIATVANRRDHAERQLRSTEDQIRNLYNDGPAFRKLAACQQALRNLDQECRELAYTIHWKSWRAEQLEAQRFHARAVLEDLKAVGGPHQTLSHRIIDNTEAMQQLAIMIRSLMPSNLAETQAPELLELRHKISHLAPFFASMHEVLSTQGHVWRRLNRLDQTGFRLPEATDHQALPEKFRAHLEAAIENATQIEELAQDLSNLRNLKRNVSKTSDPGTLNNTAKLTSTLIRFTKVLLVEAELTLQDGLLLHNPTLESKLGLQKYAILLPFARYRQTVDEVRSVLRSMDFYQKATHLTPLQQQFSMKLHDFSSHFYLTMRRYLQDVGTLGLDIVTNCLQQPDATYNAAWLERDCRQHEIAKVLSKISRNESLLFPQHTSTHRIIKDLLGNEGNKPLLYANNSIPVDYVICPLRAQRLLEELQQCPVLGVQLAFVSGKVEYVLLASSHTVIIFECEDLLWAGRTRAYFERLLEDPDVVKVMYGAQDIQRGLTKSGIVPRSVVDIDCAGHRHFRKTKSLSPSLRSRAQQNTDKDDLLQLYSLNRSWKSIAQKNMLEVLCRECYFCVF